MTRYLLDTTAIIDFARGAEPARSRLLEIIASSDVVGVCSITVAEFFAGLNPSDHPRWERFIAALDYWEASRAAAMRAGEYRYSFARRGAALSSPDCLIAAIAYEQGATLVTDNPKDFPMTDITLLSLRRK